MIAWLAANWWWLIPSALLVAWAFLVASRVKAAIRRPKPIRTMLDAAAKWFLGALGLLLGAAALSTRQFAAFIPALFMVAILHVPISQSWVMPNWGRYVAYFALFVMFLMIWDVASQGGA